jgi:D-arginine dehydrogenase
VLDARETFYFKPDAGRLLISPADETPSLPTDAYPDELAIALAIDRVQAIADLPVRRVVRSWAGLRTFAPDRTPVVGFDPVAQGFFWLAGQGGYGLQTSAAMGLLAASLIRKEPLPEALALVRENALAPERFA